MHSDFQSLSAFCDRQSLSLAFVLLTLGTYCEVWTNTHTHTTYDVGEGFSKLNLVAGDDAAAVAWTEVHSGLSLYASHSHFVRLAVEHRKAAW